MFLDIPLEILCVQPETPFREVIETVERGAKQIALVVDEDRCLLGTVTDGDVRRAVLRGVKPETPARSIMAESFTAGRTGMSAQEVLALMREKSVRHVPLVDESGVLMDLVWITDLLQQDMPDFQALIMAGGFGRRLRPLTEELPKPLLPVGDKPIMELIIEQLRNAGTQQVHVSTHYKGDKIVNHFGDGSKFGVHINYLNEEHPLGTAGALSLLEPTDRPLLVMNGDILTQVDFRAMLAFHEDHDAVLTVAVKEYVVEVPYGVLETDDVRVRKLAEKPTLRFFINAGIYLLSPEAHKAVPSGRFYNMTDLIEDLIAAGQTVVSFPIQEYWLDIGKHVDYQQAQIDIQNEVWAKNGSQTRWNGNGRPSTSLSPEQEASSAAT